jgi:EAL domain-containing protein (putative c-di-GMP-specific phosphodiesterase class I)
VGAEALIRWLHPTKGLVGPNEFIPIAEESGLITPITQWVIDETCRQLSAWCSEGQRMVPVSVNLDAWSLQSGHLATSVASALQANGLPPSAIEFEVTESNLLRDMNQACQTLQSLRDLGIRLAIDDFGTGYSSLTYLKRFPVDVIKIDRSFIKDLPANGNDGALTSAVIAMGHSLEIELVAEGVETWAQVEFLLARGCHLVQGFLFSRPVPAQDFVALVAQGLNAVPAPCPAVSVVAEAQAR